MFTQAEMLHLQQLYETDGWEDGELRELEHKLPVAVRRDQVTLILPLLRCFDNHAHSPHIFQRRGGDTPIDCSHYCPGRQRTTREKDAI